MLLGLKVSRRLREWIAPPLVILFGVSEPDRLVTVLDVDLLQVDDIG